MFWLLNLCFVWQPIINKTLKPRHEICLFLCYVMVLLVAVLVASILTLFGEHQRWHKDGVFILLAAMFSLGIWVAWIVMYTYGNNKHGNPAWGDPTLTIALVANAWVFLLVYTVPELCQVTDNSDGVSSLPMDVYANHAVGYENILKEQSSQNMFMENKAFSMDEPKAGTQSFSFLLIYYVLCRWLFKLLLLISVAYIPSIITVLPTCFGVFGMIEHVLLNTKS